MVRRVYQLGVPSGSNSVVNSNSVGQLTVDGVTDAVALIIAPGPAIAVTASTGCSAVSQARPTSGTPVVSNYLECENATGSTTFVTTKTSSATFNDQMLKITAAELLRESRRRSRTASSARLCRC
jgi:hypothetical protein